MLLFLSFVFFFFYTFCIIDDEEGLYHSSDESSIEIVIQDIDPNESSDSDNDITIKQHNKQNDSIYEEEINKLLDDTDKWKLIIIQNKSQLQLIKSVRKFYQINRQLPILGILLFYFIFYFFVFSECGLSVLLWYKYSSFDFKLALL